MRHRGRVEPYVTQLHRCLNRVIEDCDIRSLGDFDDFDAAAIDAALARLIPGLRTHPDEGPWIAQLIAERALERQKKNPALEDAGFERKRVMGLEPTTFTLAT